MATPRPKAPIEPLEAPIFLDLPTITLEFALDAGTVHGTSSADSSLSTRRGAMLGDLTGPAEGDRSDRARASSLRIPVPEADCRASTSHRVRRLVTGPSR